MEGTNHKREGGEDPAGVAPQAELEALPVPRGTSFEYGYLSHVPPEGDSWDEWVIERGIAAALRERRDIDDRTARYIASQLHEGQASALYSFASTGNVEEPYLHDELTRDFDQQPEAIKRWINALDFYCLGREDKGPVEAWSQQAAAQDRAELEMLRRNQAISELDALFGEQAEEEVGSFDEHGWFGLARHDGRPGGLMLTQDEQGFRRVWETDSDAELQERWSAINDEYEHFRRQVDARDERVDSDDHQEEGAEDALPAASDRADHVVGLEQKLAPLPDLGDIPRPAWGHAFGSGWEWMEEGLPAGWHPEPVWGRDGWNLGAWPLIAVAIFADDERGRYAVATYTEGDVEVKRYESRSALYVAVNEIAEFHWRLGQSRGPRDLPEDEGLLAKHRGPYSEERHDRQVAAEAARRVHEDGEDPDESSRA